MLFLVELRTKGWTVGAVYTPEERALATVFRLTREQRNKLQYLKVKFYRALDKVSVFKLWGKHVVPLTNLPEVERAFGEVYEEFLRLRSEIHSNLVARWSEIEEKLRASGVPEPRIQRLKPVDEAFMDMYYTVLPLPLTADQVRKSTEELEKLATEKPEYRAVARRVREEAERVIEEARRAYEERLAKLETLLSILRKTPRHMPEEADQLKQEALRTMRECIEIAILLGPEALENLKAKLSSITELSADQTTTANQEAVFKPQP
ncbi:MAG: hypothetical protein QXQ90_07130 [Desulfurococcaceae archaeon]